MSFHGHPCPPLHPCGCHVRVLQSSPLGGVWQRLVCWLQGDGLWTTKHPSLTLTFERHKSLSAWAGACDPRDWPRAQEVCSRVFLQIQSCPHCMGKGLLPPPSPAQAFPPGSFLSLVLRLRLTPDVDFPAFPLLDHHRVRLLNIHDWRKE